LYVLGNTESEDNNFIAVCFSSNLALDNEIRPVSLASYSGLRIIFFSLTFLSAIHFDTNASDSKASFLEDPSI
jgi:hypothetical protein